VARRVDGQDHRAGRQRGSQSITIDIGGVVTSTKGPEAGVWVIAETVDLPTKMSRTVVTDDQGRYVVPDLPKANYSLWVRGYGLVDSPKVQSAPGRRMNLTAVIRAESRARRPSTTRQLLVRAGQSARKERIPGTGPNGNGISQAMRSQAQWINNIKTTSCTPCHQIGNKATREIPPSLGTFDSSIAAWDARLKSGIDGGGNMYAYTNRFGKERVLKMYADWTDRIAAGEYPRGPAAAPGVERNIVVDPVGLG
jgi:hypothetical protein